MNIPKAALLLELGWEPILDFINRQKVGWILGSICWQKGSKYLKAPVTLRVIRLWGQHRPQIKDNLSILTKYLHQYCYFLACLLNPSLK
jgi:hypothetical protein